MLCAEGTSGQVGRFKVRPVFVVCSGEVADFMPHITLEAAVYLAIVIGIVLGGFRASSR